MVLSVRDARPTMAQIACAAAIGSADSESGGQLEPREACPGYSDRWPAVTQTPGSDIDLLVDLMPGGANELLRIAGIAEELSELLGTRVDVVAASLLRGEVSASALADSVAV
jgi:hypothetical protein